MACICVAELRNRCKPEGFSLLEPKYDVSTRDIADFIKQYIEKNEIKIKKNAI